MKSIDELKPIYFTKEVNLDSELFLPIASVSESLDCMIGYFTSGSLGELAEAISSYLRISDSRQMRFIISPHLEGVDLDSIRSAISTDENLLPLLFPEFDLSVTSLQRNCVTALCYLVASEKILLNVAIQKEGLFHTKCWIFRCDQGLVAVHGSGNATKGGLVKNFEQLSVSRQWRGSESSEVCDQLRIRFDKIWANTYEDISCCELNSSTIYAITEIARELKESIADESRISKRLLEMLEQSAPKANDHLQILSVPDWLNYSDQPYEHQGKAIRAWMENGQKGILAIATGGGKTLTALVAATLLNQQVESLFLIIAVPTKPLLNQWAYDVVNFGVNPINSYNKPKLSVKREIRQALRRIRHGSSLSEVLLVTHDALKSDVLDAVEQSSSAVETVLIADEVHNLGSVGFKKSPPSFFSSKIGLSATHERQLDEDGTNFLVDYFGGVVFEYDLSEAIGSCLVPYEYYIHETILTAEEEEEFCELTFEIRKLSYAVAFADTDSCKQRWKSLCLKRRKLVEAAANKIQVLDNLMPSSKYEINKSLIFCTDKYPDQLIEVNELLGKRFVNFHQITQEETGNPKLLNKVIDSFKNGDLQVLTSKRVLDEGFNVPQVETAYLVASNTVKRQWIQRLGRVLRMSENTGKTHAVIHDFLVLPPSLDGNMDDELNALLTSEYNRLSFFSRLSTNGLEANGSMYIAKKLLDIVRKA